MTHVGHSDLIELLSQDDDGNAVEGPKYPLDSSAVKYLPEGWESSEDARLAYAHKFFKRDKHGQPMPDTLVRFLVPDYLCDGPAPSRRALELVAQRMGWR